MRAQTPHLFQKLGFFYVRNTSVADTTMLALTLVSFALATAYASLCDHLLASPVDEDATS
jgi:hypothetical protein